MSVFAHSLVVAADSFAAAAHARVGQLQPYTGLQYIEHPREVARLLSLYVSLPEAIAGALVHDCIADTHETRERIAHALGNEVAQYADELAEKYQPGWSRKQKVASEIERLSGISATGKGIKCVDIAVNVQTIVQRAPDFAKVYVPEKRLILSSLLGADAPLYNLASQAIEAASQALASLLPKSRLQRP